MRLSATSLVLAVFLLIGCQKNIAVQNTASSSSSPVLVNVASSSLNDHSEYGVCDPNDMPFHEHGAAGAHGTFTFHGRVISYPDVEPFTQSDPITTVAMEVEPDESAAYQYFRELASHGNYINRIAKGKLRFTLGTLVDGHLSTLSLGYKPADVPAEIESLILTSLRSGTSIALTLTTGISAGGGAPGNYTYACKFR